MCVLTDMRVIAVAFLLFLATNHLGECMPNGYKEEDPRFSGNLALVRKNETQLPSFESTLSIPEDISSHRKSLAYQNQTELNFHYVVHTEKNTQGDLQIFTETETNNSEDTTEGNNFASNDTHNVLIHNNKTFNNDVPSIEEINVEVSDVYEIFWSKHTTQSFLEDMQSSEPQSEMTREYTADTLENKRVTLWNLNANLNLTDQHLAFGDSSQDQSTYLTTSEDIVPSEIMRMLPSSTTMSLETRPPSMFSGEPVFTISKGNVSQTSDDSIFSSTIINDILDVETTDATPFPIPDEKLPFFPKTIFHTGARPTTSEDTSSIEAATLSYISYTNVSINLTTQASTLPIHIVQSTSTPGHIDNQSHQSEGPEITYPSVTPETEYDRNQRNKLRNGTNTELNLKNNSNVENNSNTRNKILNTISKKLENFTDTIETLSTVSHLAGLNPVQNITFESLPGTLGEIKTSSMTRIGEITTKQIGMTLPVQQSNMTRIQENSSRSDTVSTNSTGKQNSSLSSASKALQKPFVIHFDQLDVDKKMRLPVTVTFEKGISLEEWVNKYDVAFKLQVSNSLNKCQELENYVHKFIPDDIVHLSISPYLQREYLSVTVVVLNPLAGREDAFISGETIFICFNRNLRTYERMVNRTIVSIAMGFCFQGPQRIEESTGAPPMWDISTFFAGCVVAFIVCGILTFFAVICLYYRGWPFACRGLHAREKHNRKFNLSLPFPHNGDPHSPVGRRNSNNHHEGYRTGQNLASDKDCTSSEDNCAMQEISPENNAMPSASRSPASHKEQHEKWVTPCNDDVESKI